MPAALRLIRPAIALCLALAGAASAQEGQPPAAVTVQTMQPQDVTLTATLPGRVRASAQAEVRPQVSGIITERLFTEGSHVEEGDVLYRIDRASYEAAYASAEAAVAQAEAQLRAAEREAERVQQLQERGISSQSTEDTAVSTRDAAQAQLQVAQAQLQTAQIDLDRTDVRALLTGEIGFSEVSAGELVTAGQATALTTIRQLDPVDVDVTQSAAELIAWRRDAAEQAQEGDAPSEVTLILADGSRYPYAGTLSAAEPFVDEQTGVVVLRITFGNSDGLLLPGMYVQVEMPTGTVPDAVLVPQQAVTRDRRGSPLALVVGEDNIVEQRALTIRQDRGADWVVTGGIEAGDRLIVTGGQNAAPGAPVSPQEPEGAAPQEAAQAEGEQAETDGAPEAASAEGE
ncbi:efflux RND transporter periplasmic adaptor subunit [Pseudoroseicyclus aestuarii]|uniref:Membrane fusion protein (Multidrug efflux system) n=1 Tax=Pseudoroseicyclus aestuarii TaxID=1795041 RepID=A0A318SVV5_9RHOB|nr:efflux RND transporter periplasmic adaptor subunit [Pseudoroseicyclus aestuarii]PYE85565.1 membrane fusion protein (multidrug efflux system) [Pseudoroseicyclus aestuarii]